MKQAKILFLSLLLHSCIPSFESTYEDRLFLKEMKDSVSKLEWFYYSTISTITPDYITIEKNGKIDTICRAENIVDLRLEKSKILIHFDGKPKRYGKAIKITSKAMDYDVIVDTNHKMKPSPELRRHYKKDP